MSEEDLVVFPNPADDQITVHLNGYRKTIQQIRLFNIQGQQLYTDQDVQSKRQILDVSNYAAGMYVLQVHTAQGVITKKIEIQ